MTSNPIEWTLEQLTEFVDQRRRDLGRGRGQPLPARVDVALLLTTALMLWDADHVADGAVLISEAVDALPGNADLIAIEDAAIRGERPTIDLLALAIGPRPSDVASEATAAEATAAEVTAAEATAAEATAAEATTNGEGEPTAAPIETCLADEEPSRDPDEEL